MHPDYLGGGLVNLMASVVEGRGGARRHAPLALLPARGTRCGAQCRAAHRRRPGRQLPHAPRCRRRAGAAPPRRDHLGVPVHHRVGDHHFVHRLHAARARPHRLVHLLRRGRLRRRAAAVSHARRHAAAFANGIQRGARVPRRADLSRHEDARHRRLAPSTSSIPITTCAIAAARSGAPTTRSSASSSEIEAAVKSGSERKFVYAYWPEYDATSHRYGSQSNEAAVQFARMDEAFGDLLRRLAGTDSIDRRDRRPRLHRCAARALARAAAAARRDAAPAALRRAASGVLPRA